MTHDPIDYEAADNYDPVGDNVAVSRGNLSDPLPPEQASVHYIHDPDDLRDLSLEVRTRRAINAITRSLNKW